MRLACCALVLAGCYDFSRFDHLSADGGAATMDLGTNSGGGVLIHEPFDTLDWTRWSSGMADPSAFSIDTSMKVEGAGALHVDVGMLSALELEGVGALASTVTLPTTSGPRTLRFYARYDGETDNDADIATFMYPKGPGAAVTLAPSDVTNPSNGADVALDELTDSSFEKTGTIVHDDAWHCFELSSVPDNGTPAFVLRIDGVEQNVGMTASSIMAPLYSVAVGFSLALTPQTRTRGAWIDAVDLTASAGPIGCPYPVGD